MAAFGLYTHIRSNAIKSVVVLIGFPFLLPAIIFAIGILIGLAGRQRTDIIFGASAAYTLMVLVVVAAITLLCSYRIFH